MQRRWAYGGCRATPGRGRGASMKSPLPGDSSGSRETLEQPVAGTQRCCSVVVEQPSLIAAESDVCVTSENLKNDICREVRMGAGGHMPLWGALSCSCPHRPSRGGAVPEAQREILPGLVSRARARGEAACPRSRGFCHLTA